MAFQGDYRNGDAAHLNVLSFGCMFHLKKKNSSHYFIVSKGRTKIKVISLFFSIACYYVKRREWQFRRKTVVTEE